MTGTGKFMRLWGYRSTQKFPRCGHHCETAAHFTMCRAPSAIDQWKTSLETLGKDLAKCHTHPGLTRFLLLRLLEWKTRTPRKVLRTMERDLHELQDAQDDIVARHPGALPSRNRKTELRTTMDKCTYTEYLASDMGPMRT
jgi:hypothetical protein